MIFIDPSLEEIYQTLINNDDIINFLKEQKLLITKAALYENYPKKEVDNMTYNIFTNNVNTLYDVAQVLLSNKSKIKSTTIADLLVLKTGWEDLAIALGIQPHELTADIYKKIIYTYKYCTVSSFFQNNRDKFIPESDLFQLENNPAAEAFLDAMMKEFDKLDMVLGKCCEYLDYDKIPWDLITYLTQMLGYEKTTFNIQEESKFRELAKNILDLYRVKGTGYSFELFFKFLGFNIKIREFYFDRRLFYLRTAGNLETSTTDQFKNEFYLTTSNPVNNDLSISTLNEVVLPSDISPQYSLDEFDELCQEYGPLAVLGYSPVYYKKETRGETTQNIPYPYTEKVYKYFKTNLIYYDISLDSGNPTPEDYKTITKCLDFLTPSYIRRGIKVNTNTGETEEELAFNGDGKAPDQGGKPTDSNGNYRRFELLDSEDWNQEFMGSYIYNEEGDINKVVDPYNYPSVIDTTAVDGQEGKSSYTPYYNSIVDNEGKRDTQFRLPIGYRLINKSANNFLTGISVGVNSTKDPAKYNDYRRLKYIVVPKIAGNEVAPETSGAELYPYFTIPPFIKNNSDYRTIQNKFEKNLKPMSLIGNYKENYNDKDEFTVRQAIKAAHITKPIKITNLTIDEYFKDPKGLGKLDIVSTGSRKLSLVSRFSYKERNLSVAADEELQKIKECYDKNIKNIYHVCNIPDPKTIDDYKLIPNDNDVVSYYNRPEKQEIYKNFAYGEFVITVNKKDSTLDLFRFGNYAFPTKLKNEYGNDIYSNDNYVDFVNSTYYDLVPESRENSPGTIKVDYLSFNDFNNAVSKGIDKRIKDMKNRMGGKYKLSIDYITRYLFEIKSQHRFYRPIRIGNQTGMSEVYQGKCGQHIFNSLEIAKNHFTDESGAFTDEVCNNVEFFVKGNMEDWDNPDIQQEHPGLYTFSYVNRNKGDLVYSLADEKLYMVVGTSDYDYVEYKDFRGRLEFYKKDTEGKYALKYDDNFDSQYIYEIDPQDIGTDERYSVGIDGKDSFCQIEYYDESWEGYDEESDNDEFIFYNSPHLVKYVPGKVYKEDKSENSSTFLPVRIGRPIKAMTDKNFDDDKVKSFDSEVTEQSIGQNIIEELCLSTVSQFNYDELSNWNMTYNKVNHNLIKDANPSEFDLFELKGGTFEKTNDTIVDEGKDYYSYMTNGFLSIAERSAENIVGGETIKDKDYDFYSTVAQFLKNYYRTIILGDYNTNAFPKELVEKYKPLPASGYYDDEQKEKIKKNFKIAMLQMGILLENLYENKLRYTKLEKKWKIDTGMVIGFWQSTLKDYCPRLGTLWDVDPLATDPYNPMFWNLEDTTKLKKYFQKYNIPLEEIDGLKKYYDEKFDDSQKKYLNEASEKSKFNATENDLWYNFAERNEYVGYINSLINKVKDHYGEQFYDYRYFNEKLLKLDSISSNYCYDYRNYTYYYRDSSSSTKIINVDNYISASVNDEIFIPYILKYGINKFSKDYYGDSKEEYAEFSELISSFVNDLANDTKYSDFFLKQIFYNKLVSLYRESFMEDDSPINAIVKGKKPFWAHPKIAERFNGKAGTFFLRNTLRNAYVNNGGKKDRDVRLKFNSPYVYIDKTGKVIMSFKINYKDFADCYGAYWNPYYNSDLNGKKYTTSIDPEWDESTQHYSAKYKDETITPEMVKNIHLKLFSCVRPFFNFKEEAKDFYNDKKNLTLWQRFRKYLSVDFPYVKVESFDKNDKPINDGTNVVDGSGKLISTSFEDKSSEAFLRIKDVEEGYIKITVESNEILSNVHENIEEISKYLNSDDVGALPIMLSSENRIVDGFLSVRRLPSKFIDNYLSFPESLKWIELDENYVAKEFCSFGDDRTVKVDRKYCESKNHYSDIINAVNHGESVIYDDEGKSYDYEDSKAARRYRHIVNLKSGDEDFSIPLGLCKLTINENGKPAIFIPWNVASTSDITEVGIIYDDGQKLTKRRKVVK